MANTKFLINILTKGGKPAIKVFETLKKSMSGVISAGKRLAKGTAIVGTALGGAGLKAVHMAGEMKKVETAFNNLNKSAGFGSGALEKYQKALDGTVSKQDIMVMSNNAMLLGIADSSDQMAEMFDIAQRLGAAVGEDAAFGVDSLVTGMGRQSKLMLDNLGIMVDLETANKRYAKELKKSVKDLTDSERKQAFNNETMRQAKRLVADLGDEQLTTSDKMQTMKVTFIDTATEIGAKLTPAFNNVLDIVGELGGKVSGTIMKAFDIDFATTGKNMLTNIGALGNAILASLGVIFDSSAMKNVFSGILVAIGFVMVESFNIIKKAAVFLFEPILVMAGNMAIKIRNLLTDALNFIIQQFNKLPGFDFDVIPRIDVKGLTFAHTSMGKFFDDEVNTNQEVVNKLKEIWVDDYASSIIETNQKVVESEGNVLDIKGKQGKAQKGLTTAIDETKKSSLESSLASITSAKEGINAVRGTIKAYFAQMIAGMLKEEVGSKGLLGLVTGAVGAAGAALLFEQLVPKFATGGDFVTSGPQMIMVGDNPGGQERVQISPLSSPNVNGPQGTVNVTFTGNVNSQDFIENEAIPQIKEAIRRGADIG